MNQASPSTARRLGASSLFIVLALAFGSRTLHAQDPELPPGWVLVDDLILPADVVFGDSTYSATQWPGGVVPYAFNANVNAAD